MQTITGNPFSNFYKRILQINQSGNSAPDSTTRNVQGGDGTSTAISLSDDVLSVQPVTDNTTGTMLVKQSGGNNILAVDTTNSKVLVGASQVAANTQYVHFGNTANDFAAFAAETHYAIPFGGIGGGSSGANSIEFGTATDPATSFTSSDTNSQYASQISKMMWYIPDNITIDAVYHIEGADNATGDTTRMHLFSYDFTSGATASLTNGVLIAHNNDITNAGNEQSYLGSWTVDSADVNSGKVILCFFRSDTINSDYSINATVKYHIR